MQKWSFLNLNLEKIQVTKWPNPYSSIQLSEVNCEKVLGIWITSSLKPSLHCDKSAVNVTNFWDYVEHF